MKSDKLLNYVDSKEKVFIYGTGKYGQAVYEYLAFYGKKIAGFVVTDGFVHDKSLNNIPIYECSELPYTDNDCVVIGTSKQFYNDIFPCIVEHDIHNVYFLSDHEYYIAKRFMQLNEIIGRESLQKDILDFGYFKMANLFKCTDNLEVIFIWLAEMRDLLFPYLNDYSEVDEGQYEYEKVQLQKNDIVIDCGANFGMFSARAAEVGCDVYAFEPLEIGRQYLNKTNHIYNDKIHVFPHALSDYIGTAEFVVCSEDLSSSRLEPDVEGEKSTVPVITLDEFVKKEGLERVDFIKADIEGAERSMLKGAKEVLKKYAPKLSICTYHIPDDVSVLTDIILEANPNYKIKYVWRKLYAWVE
ncbi:MAG: FkbM family methyltransferase [Lachnospiraceae bacterium]|nr:FkbM family methyltransferase [Lachnospiraceae bacterium]